MRPLLRAAVRNPIAVLLLVVLAVFGGVLALLHLPVSLFPGLDVPVVNVISHEPGAAAEDVELLVTRPLEDRLRAIPGVRRVASTSVEGLSQITAEFDWGTRLTDARQLVQAEVSAAQPELPAFVRPRLENIGTTLQEVAGYVVYDAGDPVEVRTAVKADLASRLMGLEGVSRVEVLGGDDPTLVVTLRPEALAREHLTVRAVAAALARANVSVASDFLERGSREYLIRGDGLLRTTTDVERVPVVADGTRSVLIGDVAEVRRGRLPRHYRVHGNGVPAVAFLVSKQPGASTIDVVRRIDAELGTLGGLLPAGAKIAKFYDQAEIIVEARDSLVTDLLLGALLAAGVLLLFLGSVRATLVVVATIPITLLAALAVLDAGGQTLNVVTLSALTLAVGMVVDDVIVVVECVVRHLDSGEDRATAALEGALEIAGPDVSGTLTTLAAFAPLLFLGGLLGLFVRPFAVVLGAALLASLAVSLFFAPAVFGRYGIVGTRPAPGARLLAAFDRTLQRLLRLALKHRGATVLLGVLALGLGGLAAWLGPIHVLPPIDEGAILVEYTMPPGTSLTESDRVADLLERQALAEPGVRTVYRRTGSPAAGFQIEGVNRGEMTIALVPRSRRRRTAGEVIASLRAEFDRLPGMVFWYRQPTQERMDESLSGLPAVFGVTVFGPDTRQLVRIAARVEKLMSEDPALGHVVNNTKVPVPQLVVRPDPPALARLGLEPADVFATIRAGRFGLPATTIVKQRQEERVLVKLPAPRDPGLDWLRQLPLAAPSGASVPLDRVADVHVEHRPAAITRLNGQREVTVLAEVEGSIPGAVARLRARFVSLDLPTGYSVAFTGQYRVLRRTIRDLALIGLAAIVLIYLVMAMQFRSWLQPLLVLTTIPVALVGAIVLLAVTRVGLDVSVGMGALTLIGIAVNNAIVLLDHANRRTAEGLPRGEALRLAASVRLRPILMTAATTVFALLPVALSTAVGSRIFQPFAVTVIGGLLSSTAATLVLVPVLAARSERSTAPG